ncbi:MAG: hypothetical protein P1U85_05180 [Verrucomicrobiales bacterium]|nr:hypothetical protein [Verrucomicrobiales bacterium]
MEAKLEKAILQCPSCRTELSVSGEVEGIEEKCPICQAQVWIRSFPRLYRAPVPRESAVLADDSKARCSFYPELEAEKVCDECGCFLSEKASVRWGDQDFCLPCLHRLREEKKTTQFLARAKRFDNRALALVTLFAPFTLFTAPIALILLWKHRKEPQGFERKSAWRWWLALFLSIAWLVGWLILGIVWASLILEDFS